MERASDHDRSCSAPHAGAPIGATPIPTVDRFGGPVPFLGDPVRSRAAGRAVQVTGAALAIYSLGRAGCWAYVAVLTSEVLNPDQATDALRRALDVGRLANRLDAFFWPTLVVALLPAVAWTHRRRPPDVLRSNGEAFVEATIRRAVPHRDRIAAAASVVCGLALLALVARPSRVDYEQVAGLAFGRALSAVAFASAWAMSIGWVRASEAHLAHRLAATATLSPADLPLPHVAPDATLVALPIGTEPAGVGWVLRTAALVLAGLVAAPVAVSSSAHLVSDPSLALTLLAVSGSVLALVIVSFARRWIRWRRSTSSP